MTWKDCKLGDLLRVEHGFAFKGEHFSDQGELVVLTPGNFHEQGGFRPRPGKDRFYAAAFPERYLLKAADLIVAMTEQGEGLLGSSALIPESNRYLHNQRLGLVRERSDRADRRFLYYLFNTPQVREQIRNTSSGAKVRHTSPERIYGVSVRVPGPPAQAKIAAILSAYDDLIANNQRRIALLEGMAEEIYREWFVRMRFPGCASAKWEHGLPSGWRAGSASEVVKVLGGGTPRTEVPAYWDGEIPFFSPKDSHGGAICIETEQTITEAGLGSCASQLFEANTIFITARGTVGNIVLAGEPMAMNQSCYALVPKNRAHLYFVFVGLRCAVSVIKGVSNSGVFDNIVMDTFKIIPMIDPGAELAEKFSNLVEPMFEQSLALRQANQALRTQRDALLPRLISGKLKVDHLDIRLPPSMRAEAEAVA